MQNIRLRPLQLLGLQRIPSTSQKVLIGCGVFTLGVLAGVGVGMLTAPREGRVLRRQLIGKAERLFEPNGSRAQPMPGDGEAADPYGIGA